MTIEIDIDHWRILSRESFAMAGLENILHQELKRIMDRHRDATIEEIKLFSVKLATQSRLADFDGVIKFSINVPDSQPHKLNAEGKTNAKQ